MIKTILVPVGGTISDSTVFATALAIAEPLGAHLAFLQIGPSDRAKTHALDFCRDRGLILTADGAISDGTASWSEETGDTLLRRARLADLTVLGRPSGAVETLLLESGRPLVMAPDAAPPEAIGSIMVGWQNKPEAARALSAAMPLLRIAKRVILVEIADRKEDEILLEDLRRHLRRHGIHPEIREVSKPLSAPEVELPSLAVKMRADLLVIGGHRHGGMTRSVVTGAGIPVFLLH